MLVKIFKMNSMTLKEEEKKKRMAIVFKKQLC